MSPLSDRSRSNPLIRRVRRHAAVATLFRSPLEEEAARPTGRATTLPTPSAAAPIQNTSETVPSGLTPSGVPADPNTPAYPRTRAYPLLSAASSSIPVGARRDAPSPAIAQAAPPAETPPPTSPTPSTAATSLSPSSDPSSPSITTPPIPVGARRDAPSLTGAPASTDVPPGPATTSVPPSPIQRATASPSARPTPPGTPAAPPLPPTAELGPEPKPASPPAGLSAELADRDWDRLSTIMRRHQEKQSPATAGQPGSSGSSASTPAGAELASTDPTEAAPPEPGTAPASEPVITPIQPSPDPAPAAPEGDLPAPDSQDETAPLGLEAAWPVRRRDPAPTRPADPAQPASGDNTAPPVPLAEQNRHAEHIQRALAGVSSAQPTGSRIEVIPPRQQRPAIAGPVQRAPTGEPASPAATAPTPGTPAVEAAPAVPVSNPESRLIETEIGPLPADLWGLLGQPAPGSPSPAVHVSAAVQRQPSAVPNPLGSPQPPEPATWPPQYEPARPDTHVSHTIPSEPGFDPRLNVTAQPAPAVPPFPTGQQPAGSKPSPADQPSQSSPSVSLQGLAETPSLGTGQDSVFDATAPSPVDTPAQHASNLTSPVQRQPGPAVHTAAQPARSETAAPATSDSNPVQRSVIINDFETVVAPQQAPSGSSTTQPAESEPAPAGEPSPQPPSTGQPVSEQPAAAQPDLDEIARQVYAEVKNRLQVEWERLRRR